MRDDDPRHGTNAGYQVHLKTGIEPCAECRAAKAATEKARRARRKPPLIDDIPLTGGRWVNQRGIQVWLRAEDDSYVA